jgi:hypothetical protein
MFLGLQDPDLLVNGMDPDLALISKKSKKNLHSYCCVTSFSVFIFYKNGVNVLHSKSNKQEKFIKELIFLLSS